MVAFLFPSFGYDRSGDEPVEVLNEWYLTGAYLGSFVLANAQFWWKVYSDAARRSSTLKAEYTAEEMRRFKGDSDGSLEPGRREYL